MRCFRGLLISLPAGSELSFARAETLSALQLSHCYEIGQRRPHHSAVLDQGPCLKSSHFCLLLWALGTVHMA